MTYNNEITFEINGATYTRKDNGYCYVSYEYSESGKIHRIGKAKFEAKYTQFQMEEAMEEAVEIEAAVEATEESQTTKETTQEAAEEGQTENIFDKLTAELEARKDRSAWDKGVTAYAMELVEELRERAAYEGRNPEPGKECREWMLNGARDWNQYSWGGSSLIYDQDIAERLCTPSELKKTRHGERRPNNREEWLDTQARALCQACDRVARVYRSIVTA